MVAPTDAGVPQCWRDAPLIQTMLDLIMRLERAGETVATVILGGPYARDHEIVEFLQETYPGLDVVVSPAESALA